MKTANNFNQTANFSKLRSRGLLRKPWSAGVSPAVTSWCWWDDCFLDIAGETPAVQDASNFRLRSFE